MKIRDGFVSNSSSSSFILVTKEPITEEFLHKEYEGNPWAEPFVDYLANNGNLNDLYDTWEFEGLDNWKKWFKVEPEAQVTEYLTANWGVNEHGRNIAEVCRALYHHGARHLETPNIRVFPGTREC